MKLLTVALLTVMVLGILANITTFSNAQTGIQVNGILSQNTAWTKANSPYTLTDDILVNDEVTLTIEAGATIILNSYYIRVNGSLIVEAGVTINMPSIEGSIQVNGILQLKGTSNNPIQINGINSWQYWAPTYSSIVFSKTSVNYNQQTGTGCIIENTNLNQTYITTYPSLKIVNSTQTGGGLSIEAGSPIILDNILSSQINIRGGSPIISNNNITGGFISYYGQSGQVNATISDNIISSGASTSTGISFIGSWGIGGHVVVERNLITDNQVGIQVFSPNFDDLKTTLTIQNNTITNNSVGISILNPYSPTIVFNNIQNSINIKLSQNAKNNIDATNNYWGTANIQAINQSIYDFKNDFDLGTVNFTPFLTEPNSQALPDPNAPIPTTIPLLTPNITSSPTPTLTPATTMQSPASSPTTPSTPMPSPDSSPKDNSTSPLSTELALIVIAVVVVAVAVVSFLLGKRVGHRNVSSL